MPRPKGSKNTTNSRPWSDAIARALARRETDKGKNLNSLAEKLLDKGLEGDLAALKELGDRLDGKPAQAVTGPDGAGHELVLRWATPKD